MCSSLFCGNSGGLKKLDRFRFRPRKNFTSVVAIYYDYCYLTTIVTFIFVVACVWPPPFLSCNEFIKTWDSSSRLTMLDPASPWFEIQIEPGPWKYRPIAATSRRSLLHHTDKAPRLHWAAAICDSHCQHGACGRRIDCIVLFAREGKRWYVTRSVKRSCFARLGDQVCGLNLSCLFTLHTTISGQASSFFRKLFWVFFLVNFVPLFLTG